MIDMLIEPDTKGLVSSKLTHIGVAFYDCHKKASSKWILIKLWQSLTRRSPCPFGLELLIFFSSFHRHSMWTDDNNNSRKKRRGLFPNHLKAESKKFMTGWKFCSHLNPFSFDLSTRNGAWGMETRRKEWKIFIGYLFWIKIYLSQIAS